MIKQYIIKLFNNFTKILSIKICLLITGAKAYSRTDLTINKIRIFYANHSSHLDSLIILASLPKNIRDNLTPIAAVDYWGKNNLMRYFAKIFNLTLINRFYKGAKNNINPIEKIVEQLNLGKSVLIFPEGTRSPNGQIQKFKNGLYYIIKEFPKAEIIPIYLDNLHRALPKGGHFVIPILCKIIFGDKLTPPLENEDKQTFINRAKQQLENLKNDFTR